MDNPPVKLAKIAIGDPALGSNDEFKTMPVLQTLTAHPSIINYDVDVFNYFKEQYVYVNLFSFENRFNVSM
jgi:carboxypeptidase D